MALIRSAVAKEMARDAVVLDLADVRRQGELIIEQARKQAAQIVEQAKAERARLIAGATEKGREEGRAQGLAEGRKTGADQGREAALKEFRPRLDGVVNGWTKAAEAFAKDREAILAEAKAGVVELALRIAERIVCREIELHPEQVIGQVETVLAMVTRRSEVAVAVNPEDRGVLNAAMPSLVATFDTIKHLSLVDDPSLSRGSCVARIRGEDNGGGGGEIDASIPTQLGRIAEALLPADVAEPGADSGSGGEVGA